MAIDKLYAQGWTPLLRRNEKAREKERLAGERDELAATVKRLKAQASEIQIQMLQIDSEIAGRLSTDLKDTEMKLAQITGQKTASDFEVGNVTLKAPVAGRIHQLAVHTKGGVVAPGEALMQIVPAGDSLVVDANINPTNIDDVRVGGRTFVRLTALSSRKTPELVGTVESISPDTKLDERTGATFYSAKIRLDVSKLNTEVRGKLLPGMPVEVQIETPSRTALNYLLKPLTDQVHRSFKE